MTPKLMSAIVTLTTLVLFGDQQHIFGINGKPVLCVPESDMDPLVLSYADESTHLVVGSGHTPGFSFVFRPELMRSIIAGYVIVRGFEDHPYVNALSGTVGFLGQDERERFGSAMRARTIEDEWYARDKCPRPIVRSLVGTSLYEVKCSSQADYGAIWNRTPSPTTTMPNPNEFIIATCKYEDIQFGPYKGRSLKNCQRVFIVDQFLIDYRFQEENIAAVPQIDSMMREKLSLWKRNCSSRA
jgi:hypothetical protein